MGKNLYSWSPHHRISTNTGIHERREIVTQLPAYKLGRVSFKVVAMTACVYYRVKLFEEAEAEDFFGVGTCLGTVLSLFATGYRG